MNFRNDIQGLRAIAVLFVFIFHLSNTYLTGGFIGVDMFFVISGYLISKIVHSKINKGTFSIIDFYIGRVKRIVPAYFFMLICAWVLFMLIFANTEIGKFKMAHFHTILFNSNNHFAKVDDYFGASSNENPFLHTWTLAVEMQFYFILPLFLLFIRNIKYLLTVLAIITVGLFGYSTYEIFNGNQANMYFSLLARSPEFFLGVILALSRIEEKVFIKNNATILSTLGIITLVLSAVLLTEQSPFPGVTSLIPCLGIGMVLIAPTSKINDWISNKTFAYLGEISYSVYLWHWPIMAFYRYTTERYEFTFTETIIVIGLTAIASLISYYLIERPLRGKNGLKFYVPFGIMIVLNVLMVYFVVPVKNKVSNIPDQYIFPNFGKYSHGKDFKKVDVFGDTTYTGKKILLLGDSHGLTFKPYLDTLGKKHGFSFRTITNDTYPAIPNIDYKEIFEPNRLSVYKNLEPHIEKEIARADLVIVFFAKEGIRWKDAIDKTISSLDSNQKIMFVSDYPSVDRNPVRATKGFIRNKDDVKKYKIIYTPTSPEVKAVISKYPNAEYVDMSEFKDFFKDAPFYKDTLMYYDATHLNRFGVIHYSEYSGNKILETIKRLTK